MLRTPCHPGPGAAPPPACELADIVRRYGQAYRAAHRLPRPHHKVLRAIDTCRTTALGGHREHCAACGHERLAYNSCRNRHCPKCQALAKAQWVEARQAEVLPVGYFHTVFTLPHELTPLILCREQNQRAVLNLLFRATAETLLQFGRNNLGGTLGATLVLHTWDQQLRPHFHLHAVIPGGALSFDRTRWLPAHPRYLFPVRALSQVFRGKFLAGLGRLHADGDLVFPAGWDQVTPLADAAHFADLVAELRRTDWVVYSKAPFTGPEKLLAYLGHYTHRVAISNRRLVSCDDGQVMFHYRDRAAGDVRKTMVLPADEFLRRFLCHVLPAGFQRIRQYGLLANRGKQEDLNRCRELLAAPPARTAGREVHGRLGAPTLGHRRDLLPAVWAPPAGAHGGGAATRGPAGAGRIAARPGGLRHVVSPRRGMERTWAVGWPSQPWSGVRAGPRFVSEMSVVGRWIRPVRSPAGPRIHPAIRPRRVRPGGRGRAKGKQSP